MELFRFSQSRFAALVVLLLAVCAIATPQYRLQPDSKSDRDKSASNGVCQHPHRIKILHRESDPQSQIYVVDTAIVLSTIDTTRCLYSYNSNGMRLCRSTQRWHDGIWVDTLRYTNTYDANGRMLSHLFEIWQDSLWVNYWRQASMYDAQGNLTSFRSYLWSISSWIPYDGPIFFSDSAGNFYDFSFCYNLTLVYKVIVTGVASQPGGVPGSCSLHQNYPNPFNPSTTIKYELPSSAIVNLAVYDLLGREVSVLVNERKDAGVHEIKFDGSNLASGVYLYRLTAGDFVQARKLLLVR